MRQVALIRETRGDVHRVMLHDTGEGGAFLFFYRTPEDGPSFADAWFESADLALESARIEFGLGPDDWQPIPDPMPGCQHDQVVPIEMPKPIVLTGLDEADRPRFPSPRLIQPG